MHVLHLHGHDADAGLVRIQNLLHQVAGLGLDFLLAGGQGVVDLAVADDLAHGRLTRVDNGLDRIGHVEQIVLGVLDHPLHNELHGHDVLVAGQHQRLFGHLAAHALLEVLPEAAPRGPEAELHAPDLRHLGGDGTFHRVRNVVIRPRRGDAAERAEALHHAHLVGFNDVEPAGDPEEEDEGNDEFPARQVEPLEAVDLLLKIIEARRPAAGAPLLLLL